MVTALHTFKKYCKLLQIPPEILIQILNYLDCRALLTVQASCRMLREIIFNSVELRYIIELGADNLSDNPRFPSGSSPPLTTQERLNLLLDRRRRWRTLDWTQRIIVPLPGACQAYELVGGVFAKSMRGNGNEDLWPPGSKHLMATWLPTRHSTVTDGIHGSVDCIVTEDLGIPTRDFAIDPTQDILALVEVDVSSQIMVHVKTLRTQAMHPLAARSPLISPAPPSETLQQLPVGSCFVQICGDVIGMFFWHSGSTLRIWNWRTGALVVSQNETELPTGAWDFAFVSPRVYMIACIGHSGALELYTINGQAAAPEPPIHVVALHLPPLLIHRQLRSISTHSAPYLANPETVESPFIGSQDYRIHLIQLHYGDLLPQYTLYVKNEYLLAVIRQMNDGTGVYRLKRHVPADMFPTLHFATPGAPESGIDPRIKQAAYLAWEAWGPQNTRFMQQSLHFQWLRYIHGHRIVLPPTLDHQQPVFAMPVPPEEMHDRELRIYDFNVHPKRVDDPCDTLMELYHQEALSKGVEPQWQYELIHEPTVLPGRDLFRGQVVSNLPYSSSRLRGTWRYTGFMIDDQRLVGMKDTMFHNASACDLEVFTM